MQRIKIKFNVVGDTIYAVIRHRNVSMPYLFKMTHPRWKDNPPCNLVSWFTPMHPLFTESRGPENYHSDPILPCSERARSMGNPNLHDSLLMRIYEIDSAIYSVALPLIVD